MKTIEFAGLEFRALANVEPDVGMQDYSFVVNDTLRKQHYPVTKQKKYVFDSSAVTAPQVRLTGFVTELQCTRIINTRLESCDIAIIWRLYNNQDDLLIYQTKTRARQLKRILNNFTQYQINKMVEDCMRSLLARQKFVDAMTASEYLQNSSNHEKKIEETVSKTTVVDKPDAFKINPNKGRVELEELRRVAERGEEEKELSRKARKAIPLSMVSTGLVTISVVLFVDLFKRLGHPELYTSEQKKALEIVGFIGGGFVLTGTTFLIIGVVKESKRQEKQKSTGNLSTNPGAISKKLQISFGMSF